MYIPHIFEHIAREYFVKNLGSLKSNLIKARTGIIFEVYVTRMLFFTAISFLIALTYSAIILIVLGIPILASLAFSIVAALLSGALIFVIFYLYPSYAVGSKKKSIESNLPFAANHMSALATSGVPPHIMFRMLTDAKEYGQIADEANQIVRNINMFGMDVVSAIRKAANNSPSPAWSQFLSGIASTIMTGGDLRSHLEIAAHDALADYRIRREKYLSTLSTYADFYVGVLIAAPLFFISILSLLAIIGGHIGGFSVQALIALGIYVVIPLLNIIFLIFVHLTQPSV